MRPSADDIVAAARAWLGTPYRHQAATLGAGCDCLGLLRGVWRSLYGDEPVELPPYRADWRDQRHAETLLAAAHRLLRVAALQLAPGQVVLFRLNGLPSPKHCGILVAPDRFIHAQERLGVIEGNLTEGWRRRIAGRFDFPPIETL
jgi:NlpC/P60 family putative phage cell wall peptidase